ncbi:MAG: hypothetical protein Fur0035_08520 [Anaerolineales bacterium]
MEKILMRVSFQKNKKGCLMERDSLAESNAGVSFPSGEAEAFPPLPGATISAAQSCRRAFV